MFPGQGSQTVGMGSDLYEEHEAARFTFDAAGQVLGFDIAELCFEGPADKLAQTEFTQPALLTHSIATLRVLQENDFTFDIAFGHSLGEYCALVATDALGFDDALRLVRRRGQAMTAAAARNPGAMVAVLGLDGEAVEALCDAIDGVWPANFNSPGQVVCSGTVAGVAALEVAAAAAGAKRCVRLNVSGAFHSPLVADAVDELREPLAETSFAEPAPPFFSVCTVDYEVEDFDALLLRQVVSPVRFEQAVRRLFDEGYNAFLEVGPGSVLAGLVKRIAPEAAALSVGDLSITRAGARGLAADRRGTTVSTAIDLSGKVALVTGAGRGIGREIALALAAAGADVAVNDFASEDACLTNVTDIEKLGVRGLCVMGDVADEDGVGLMIDRTENELGPIAIVVNNAGITRDNLVAMMSPDEFDAVIRTHLRGTFLVSKAASRKMLRRREGAIINIASVVGRRGNAGQANYAAAKAGIIGLTKSLAKELGARNIRVNAIAPGYIDTPMTQALPEETRKAIVDNTPLRAIGEASDVAAAVMYLASPLARFITGVTLPVDGGLGI